jgi:Guanylate-binding protein, N-terminal domain
VFNRTCSSTFIPPCDVKMLIFLTYSVTHLLQMGGIDESALDRLSLVTEMTKHIRVRASGGRTTASELGQFSPVFVWLLRDFYLDLTEDNRKITPRDYLELALRPMQGGRNVSSKNEIRESIRALFPDRECFTLVRPLNNEKDLQSLDQIPVSLINSFLLHSSSFSFIQKI